MELRNLGPFLPDIVGKATGILHASEAEIYRWLNNGTGRIDRMENLYRLVSEYASA